MIKYNINKLKTISLKFTKNAFSHEKEYVNDFYKLYKNRPCKQNSGGSGSHNCFWLYTTLKIFNPSYIIESGVWYGQTTWIFRNVCKNADIYSFELNMERRKYIDPKTNYNNIDWNNIILKCENKNHICFFDDHVSHALRLNQCYKKGFKYLIFDDNFFRPRELKKRKAIPKPTISMIINNNLSEKKLIKQSFIYPNISNNRCTNLIFVELKDKK